MADSNILLTRIDNRLIHGQVATQWTSTIGANLILVANDAVAADSTRQNLMKMAAPSGVTTRFLSLQDAIDAIGKASPKQRIFIIVETPEDALALVKGGVPIKQVNVGNMHLTEGKRQVTPTVAVSDEDVATFKELRDLGVELEVRRVPSTPVEDVDKLFA